jgi:predicted dehydrogenase
MARRIHRREFLGTVGAAGAGLLVSAPSAYGYVQNDKLRIAAVGAGGRAEGDIDGVKSQNIVALCDVDQKRLEKKASQFAGSKQYQDFRKMIEECSKDIDAVVIGAPDHIHAPAAAMAIKLGKHVYVEKPMTHDIFEARTLRELAAKHKVATQMGNQGTASGGLRRGVEVIQAGALGTIKEIHLWTNRPVWPQAPNIMERPASKKPPDSLNWDCWLGPAPYREYHDNLHPFNWRGWIDFGTGALGDMACHTTNLPFFAAQLTAPISAEAECGDLNKETWPSWAKVKFEFPAREVTVPAKATLPPVTVTWYEGKKNRRDRVLPPEDFLHGEKWSDSGSLIVGSKGVLFSGGDYGDNWKLLPAKDFEGHKGPSETLPRSPGHHEEWIRACKGGNIKPMSNFDHAGPFTEFVLLGNVAILMSGKKILWDTKACKVTNAPEAARLVKREYRKGWTL